MNEKCTTAILPLTSRRDVHVHRFDIAMIDDDLQFRSWQATSDGWIPNLPEAELSITCFPGVNAITFQIAESFDAAFPSDPFQWIDPKMRRINGQYVPRHRPNSVRILRDADKQATIWIDNLNYGTEPEEHAFLVLVLGADGKVYSSADPTIYNEPDEGTDP